MEYSKHTLPNGVRLVFTPMPASHSVGVNIFVGTGSRNEPKEINGLSHFLEHIVFKGTKSFENSKVISEEIEGVGGIINAYTSDSVTNFHVKVTAEHFVKAFALVSSLVLEPLIREDDINKERGVILEEINRKEDNPQDKVFEDIAAITFPNHALGRPTLGTPDVVKGITRADFVDYRNKYYVSENLVVSIAGNITYEMALEQFTRAFSSLPKAQAPGIVTFTAHQTEPHIFIEAKKTEQAHFCLSVRGLNIYDEKRFPLFLLDSVLGSGMSSRLFLNIREKGLAYSVGSSPDLVTDTGALFVYAGFSVGRIAEALSAVMGELRNFKTDLVAVGEFAKALAKQKGPILFHLEDPENVAEWYGKQEIMKGEIETEETFIQKLSNLRPSDVKALANDFLTSKNLNLAIIGPYKEKQKEGLQKLLVL